MTNKNIQLKNKSGELLNPKTFSRNVIDEFTGKPIYDILRDLSIGSGWQNLSLLNGFKIYGSGDRVMIKKIGSVVYLSGTVVGGTSNIMAMLPTNMRPGQVVRVSYLTSKGTGYCAITPEGEIILNGYSSGSFEYASIDGIVYSL